MKHSPAGRQVVITGATRGIGCALAREFARGGHTVSACGRDRTRCAALTAELGAPHGIEALDVRDDAAVARWATQVLEAHGPPDLLINNAGVLSPLRPLWQVPPDEFDLVIDVNLKGIANVVRHFVPAMVERGRGVIVNFSSDWGRSTSPGVASYCATKWGVEGLTRALAQELPAGLAAVALTPGVVHTEMLVVAFGASGAAECAAPEDWARTAVPRLLELGPSDSGKTVAVRV